MDLRGCSGDVPNVSVADYASGGLNFQVTVRLWSIAVSEEGFYCWSWPRLAWGGRGSTFGLGRGLAVRPKGRTLLLAVAMTFQWGFNFQVW